MTACRERAGLGLRLLVGFLVVSAIGLVAMFLTVRLTAPSFFDQHVAQGPAMGRGSSRLAEESEALDRALVDTLNEGFMLAFVIAVPLAIVASLLISRQLSRPMKQLAVASRHIAAGDYEHRVEPGGPPELQELALGFNKMAGTLAEVEQRRVTLIGDVAHELRTPVTVIRGYVEGLKEGVFPPGPETYALLHEETSRLTRLVEDLQSLSQAESGRLQLTDDEVDLAVLARELHARFAPAFQERGLGFVVETPGAVPPVCGDRERLVQVVSNLLNNALQYTATGEVRMLVIATDRQVQLSVTDTGIGMTPQECGRVFERFYRTDPSRSRRSGGAGVGLTIARALVAAMGGTISAASPGAGMGSTFTLSFPAA